MRLSLPYLLVALAAALAFPPPAAGGAGREEAEQALRKAAHFFHSEVSVRGGYVWRCSADLTLREGEGKAGNTRIWVQPPGTPTVGGAFLRAYQATGDRAYLQAALDAAYALVEGQMRTGGWFYHIEFDPRKRQRQKTTLDDDTTQSAARFLMRVDRAVDFRDERIHKAVEFCLTALLRAQYPNGGWYQNWDRYPSPPDPREFPVIKASYPETWSRRWLNDWTGRYFINDNVASDMIDTMFLAYDIYAEERFRRSALRAGEFLLLAQMPDPQPAWAQQYDVQMHPAWDRKFEPPAITGAESQTVMESLLYLYRRTGDRRYLDSVGRALDYLKKSRLPDGRLARFYELKTNRPLYFTRDYRLTYDSREMPTHYSFIVGSRLDEIEREYHRLKAGEAPTEDHEARENLRNLAPRVRAIIAAMDERGAWVEPGVLDAHNTRPTGGIISSRTFAQNVEKLCAYIEATR